MKRDFSVLLHWSRCVKKKQKNRHDRIPRNFLYMLPVTVARSSSDDNTIRYALPVLWMTSCFYIMERIGQNQRRHVCFVQFARCRHQLDVRWRCLIECARWRYRGRSVSSPTAFCSMAAMNTILGADTLSQLFAFAELTSFLLSPLQVGGGNDFKPLIC